jgi:hypothetical protein
MRNKIQYYLMGMKLRSTFDLIAQRKSSPCVYSWLIDPDNVWNRQTYLRLQLFKLT